ncbi:flavoprotein [Xylariomycetidae sp. FL0641]|nr:flavoprotein [Xylariomycetidae sp. FL0641]
MLQTISPHHDPHYERTRQNSLASLTASHSDGKRHLLLAASGSVATIKLPQIITALGSSSSSSSSSSLSIRVLLTPSAARFLAGQSPEQPSVSSLRALPGVDGVYADADEWREPWARGRGILHIELRRWADMLVIAPLSANSLAKIAGGFADGLLSSVVRAWDAWAELDSDLLDGGATEEEDDGNGAAAVMGDADGLGDGGDGEGGRRRRRRRQKKKKLILVAPAMNTAMWRHPVTGKHLRVLEGEWGVDATLTRTGTNTHTDANNTDDEKKKKGDGDHDHDKGWFEVLRPQQKRLACGDVGDGAMMEWTEIVAVVRERLGLEGGAEDGGGGGGAATTG